MLDILNSLSALHGFSVHHCLSASDAITSMFLQLLWVAIPSHYSVICWPSSSISSSFCFLMNVVRVRPAASSFRVSEVRASSRHTTLSCLELKMTNSRNRQTVLELSSSSGSSPSRISGMSSSVCVCLADVLKLTSRLFGRKVGDIHTVPEMNHAWL
ncbi:hypothetical protein NEOLEDRAFT_529013 [Neolentinus lepideus HHB14362 ss-1]|uniref:Uncharacterized protein n=1 Tax=Neolentinus lepideus HHB14362 ss-1 TaxID=1314782 RepID=A0A165REQ4_9AGAM|nr:hypothetical protein NEOLEDRAFT_529013 [Neolentinus lepideus HHB14362 ss-1]